MILTQKIAAEPLIREPEMLHAFCRTLDTQGVIYGIETPTELAYRFVDEIGENRVSARHDLVLLTGDERQWKREVLVELKRGQNFRTISKDLQKLFREDGCGKCMFHICHAVDRGAIPALVEKYNLAFDAAIVTAKHDAEIVGRPIAVEGCWFSFYILALRDRRQNNQPELYAYRSPSLADLHARQPVFDMGYFEPSL